MRRDVFQAIADPTRRAIIVLIAFQSMTPNTISEHFDITRQAVSKHLRILTECELVKQEHQGREIYYQLEETTLVNVLLSSKSLEDLEKIIEMGFKEGFTSAIENLDALLERK